MIGAADADILSTEMVATWGDVKIVTEQEVYLEKILMASKRHQRRKSCEGKIQYPDESAAAEIAKRLTRRDSTRMSWYRCKFCKKWHIGHRQNARFLKFLRAQSDS